MARSSRGSASCSEMRPALRSRMTSSTQAGRGRLPITVVGNRVATMEKSSEERQGGVSARILHSKII